MGKSLQKLEIFTCKFDVQILQPDWHCVVLMVNLTEGFQPVKSLLEDPAG